MTTKKTKLQFKKSRVVLSEVLPYEVPLTFSNRHFYDFLVSNKINYLNQDIEWKKGDNTLDTLITIIFGPEPYPDNKRDFVSIPFEYRISHKENEFRELAVCHPRNQLQMIEFYDQFKELILYYCSISPYSIRRPQRVANFVYHNDKTHLENLSRENCQVEESEKEYKNLRSFFVYKDYSNVYKFYESYKFHRCEKKYNKLLKLDITKCFNSIYTHSLAWAIFNKEGVKESLGQSKNTFAGLFDSLMQQLNYNETNGIIIGPEFSRIFSELILQSVDCSLEDTLNNSYQIRNKEHYEIFRYVDDYFVFYNDEKTKQHILESLQIHLKDYKLSLNVSKQIVYEKPIITEITIAKKRIKSLLNEKLVFTLTETDNLVEEKKFKGIIKIRANPLITEFKTIIKECSVEYRDILNYALSIIEKNSESILKNYLRSDKNEEQLIKAILEIIEFIFFIYSVSPRVNTTIKLCRILATFIPFIKIEVKNDFKHLVFKSIFDNACFILQKNKHTENTQVETLYLLITLAELGKEYRLDESVLSSFFDISKDDQSKYHSSKSFNYFSLTVLIFYMKDKKRYSDLMGFIEQKIQEKFQKNKKLIWKDTELILLLLDTLVCPYVSIGLKSEILKLYGVSEISLQQDVINMRKQWFTCWKNFDFQKELDAKRSKEVY